MAMALKLVVVAAVFALVESVDRSKFKTCTQAGFCKRHRDKTAEPEWHVAAGSLALDAATATLSATVQSAAPGAPPFDLRIAFYATGVARVRLAEHDDKPPRWEVRVAGLVEWLDVHAKYGSPPFGSPPTSSW